MMIEVEQYRYLTYFEEMSQLLLEILLQLLLGMLFAINE